WLLCTAVFLGVAGSVYSLTTKPTEVAGASAPAKTLASQTRADIKAKAEKDFRVAQQSTEECQRAFAAAQERLNQLAEERGQVEDELRCQSRPSIAPPLPQAGPQEVQSQPVEREPAHVELIENPARAELEAALAELQRQREELLIDRTPLHPAVQDLTLRITALEEKVAAEPRWLLPATDAAIEATPLDLRGVPAGSPAATPDAPPLAADSSPAPESASARSAEVLQQRLAEIDATYCEQQSALSQAETLLAQAREQERLALAACQTEPAIEVIQAVPPADTQRALALTKEAFLPAVGCGAAAALGLGMLISALWWTSTCVSLRKLESLGGVPILGVVPATCGPYSPPPAGITIARLSVLLFAAVLLAVGVGGVLVAFNG
ncbi:MAG: hypothetical protein ACOY3P_22180, partial [Planctomycetota bacterium]